MVLGRRALLKGCLDFSRSSDDVRLLVGVLAGLDAVFVLLAEGAEVVAEVDVDVDVDVSNDSLVDTVLKGITKAKSFKS